MSITSIDTRIVMTRVAQGGAEQFRATLSIRSAIEVISGITPEAGTSRPWSGSGLLLDLGSGTEYNPAPARKVPELADWGRTRCDPVF